MPPISQDLLTRMEEEIGIAAVTNETHGGRCRLYETDSDLCGDSSLNTDRDRFASSFSSPPEWGTAVFGLREGYPRKLGDFVANGRLPLAPPETMGSTFRWRT